MQIDLFNIWFVLGCCVLPYIGLVTSLLVISIRSRLRYRNAILKKLETKSSGESNPSKSVRSLAVVYLILSFFSVGGLLGLMLSAISYYLGFPYISSINIKTLGVISITVLLLTLVGAVVVAVLSKRILRIKE